MIFVTVGTHEQPFNRLIEYIDHAKGDGLIADDIIIQTGFSTYRPEYCKWKALFPYEEMVGNVAEARIVITHGGPASFIMPIQMGKIPIVVPRQHKFNEHVNDHQVDFVRAVAKKKGMIIPVYRIEKLGGIVLRYNDIVEKMPKEMKSNNRRFNEAFQRLAENLYVSGMVGCKERQNGIY